MLPEELRQWRDDHHLTQPELAALLGIHEQTLSRWENNARDNLSPLLELALEALDARLRKQRR